MADGTPLAPSAPYVAQMNGSNLAASLQALPNNGGAYARSLVTPGGTGAFDRDQYALQLKINNDQLHGQVDGLGTDPEVTSDDAGLGNLSAAAILAGLHGADGVPGLNPQVVQSVAAAWGDIGSQLAAASDALSNGLSKIVAESWSGTAASNAAAAVGTFVSTVTNVALCSTQVGNKIQFAQRGIQETSQLLTPLVPLLEQAASGGPTPTKPPYAQTGNQQIDNTSPQEALTTARTVLSTVYSPGIRGGDQGVPTFPGVQPVVNDGAPGAGTANSLGNGANGPAGTATGPKTTGTDPGTAAPGTTGPGDTGSGANNQGGAQSQQANSNNGTGQAQDASGAGSPAAGSPGDPNQTHAASAGPGLPDLGAGGGGGGGGGLGDAGGGGLGSSELADPSLGRAGVGTVAAAAAPGAGTPVAGGRPGSPGMGMPGGAKGKGEGDKEHRSAAYLRGPRLADWLTEEQRGLPAFGVIGDWGAQAPQGEGSGSGDSAAAQPDSAAANPPQGEQR